MKQKTPLFTIAAALACCSTTLHADPLVILSEAFDNTGPDAPLSNYGWSVLVTESALISNYGTQSRAIGVAGGDYAFYAPKADDAAPWTAAVLNDPALASTPLPSATDISELISVAWDSSSDNVDHVFRVVVQVGGVWYASFTTFNDGFPDSGTAAANFVSLLFNPASFATAANWLTVQNTTLGAAGTLSLGAAPGADLTGEVTAIGLYLVSGVDNETAGDHIRFDNFKVTVDGPPLPPLLKWGTGDDNWTAANVWKDQTLATATFADGIDVMFEDIESGASPVTVTLNDTVSPLSTTFDATKDFTITGSGKISGTTGLTKNGSGVATLATANDHTGGTILNAGKLNIDHASALGATAGTFVINDGTIDNTSGSAIVNANNNPMEWNADFTFAGTNSLDLGSGPVTLATAGFTDLTVTSNNLTVGGIISGGSTFGLYKKGGGTLTLTGASDFTGSVILAGAAVRVTSLANGNQPSSLGAASGGAGTIQIGNGTLSGILEYIGTGAVSTTRQVRIGNSTPNPTTGSATLVNDNADPADTMSFTANPFNALATSTSAPNGPGDRSLTLDGSNEGDNTITGEIRDNQINSGTGFISLIKSGTGTWSLTGVNTYTGDTTVNDGVLKINGSSIYDLNTLVINGTGKVNLTNTESVLALEFEGNPQPLGDYSATSVPGGATITTASFSGTGTLKVGPAPSSGFASWITGGGFANDALLVGNDGPNDDPDNDGISNLVEYALDGFDPTAPNAAPGSITGLLVTYNKRALAVTNGDVTYSIEESTDLGISDAWATATPTTDDGTVITYTLTPPAPSKDFVRLKVIQP